MPSNRRSDFGFVLAGGHSTFCDIWPWRRSIRANEYRPFRPVTKVIDQFSGFILEGTNEFFRSEDFTLFEHANST